MRIDRRTCRAVRPNFGRSSTPSYSAGMISETASCSLPATARSSTCLSYHKLGDKGLVVEKAGNCNENERAIVVCEGREE